VNYIIRKYEEEWEPLPDNPALEFSQLGRVRNAKTKEEMEVTDCTASEFALQVFDRRQAEVAMTARRGGVKALGDLREALLEQLEAVDEAVALLTFDVGIEPVSARTTSSIYDFAVEEARQLGEAIRNFKDRDPVSDMTRSEKLARLRSLRMTFGEEIDRASQLNAFDPIFLKETAPCACVYP
jgi:hypothetical protein